MEPLEHKFGQTKGWLRNEKFIQMAGFLFYICPMPFQSIQYFPYFFRGHDLLYISNFSKYVQFLF